MIKATVLKSTNGSYIGFECKGHAGFARKGKDIVCAAISVLTLNTFNSIECLTDTDIIGQTNDGYLSWKFSSECDDKATILMDSLVLGLNQIQDEYNKYLVFEMKEV